MNKAERRVWPISPWIMGAVGLGLVFFESGCAELAGLRSVAPERPSVLGLWDKTPEGSPTPGTDHYAQNVHSAQQRLGREPGAADGPLLAQARPLDPLDEGTPAESAADDRSKQQLAETGSAHSTKDERVYVTLGRPEPLRALALDARSRRLASATPSSSWRAERSTDRTGAAEQVAVRSMESRDLGPAERASLKKLVKPHDASEGRDVLAQAEAKLRSLESYRLKVSRVERVGGQLQPPEELSLSVRTKPKAVRLEWAEGPNKGREVIYSSALDPRMMYVHVANSAIPLPSMKIPIDSPVVMRNSRHSITEAGLDTIIQKLAETARNRDESDKQDKLEYRGLTKAAGVDKPCHQFVIRSASDEVWNIFLDARSHLPCMVIGEDRRGELIERYIYRDLTANPADLALADAFEPDKRWGESQGLLSRLARAATGSDLPAGSQSRTR